MSADLILLWFAHIQMAFTCMASITIDGQINGLKIGENKLIRLPELFKSFGRIRI